MNAGSVVAKRTLVGRLNGRLTVVILVSMLMVLQTGIALGQTPDEACAADSLYLISPDMVDLKLETEGRKGLTISWPNLDLEEATCFSLDETDNLGFDVTVSGGFGDRVDREFSFFSPDEGTVGGLQPQNVIVQWQNDGPGTYGNIGGKINLSNNGGIWRYAPATGWVQDNSDLPMSWLQANCLGLDSGAGTFMLAGFSRGATLKSNPAGLYTFDGTDWMRISEDTFGDVKLVAAVAVSPTNNDWFAVGTDRNGLFITKDGGVTYTQWSMELDPTYDPMPTNFEASVVEWVGDRVYVFINNYGLFISQDNGDSFTRSELWTPANLNPPRDNTPTLPIINSLNFHPGSPDRVAACLDFHGVYESLDGGVTWTDLYGDLVVPDPEDSSAWVHTGLDLVYDDVSTQTMVLGVKQRGIYQTTDGGATWVQVDLTPDLQPDNRALLLEMTMMGLEGSPGTMFIMEDNWALLRSTDSGATWSIFDPQPVINKGHFLISNTNGDGSFTLGSWGGGIYVAGSTIPLTETYGTATSDELRDLDLGLSISFSSGPFNTNDSFKLVCQTFQGWAVWRGASHDQDEMTLLGLYDRVNPEDCYIGYCGDLNIEIVPNCFATKRAVCFNLENPDTIRFFDEEIYNGFTYNYSVTSFDYGNTALATPENNDNSMIFSPRFEGDLLENGGVSPFPGAGNQTMIQINEPIGRDEDGYKEIYVFPNPLRSGAGFPRDEGGTVTFANIPPESKILVFTTAGDKVIEIGPEAIRSGNVHWDTRNSSGEQITSGIFLYKVDIPGKEAYWGRLVVIR